MIIKCVKWRFPSLRHLEEGTFCTKKKKLKHLQNSYLPTSGLQNKYFHRPSVKNQKTEVVFFHVPFDLEVTSFLEMCVSKKLWHSVLSNMRHTKCAFWCESRRCAQLLHHPECACNGLFDKIVYFKLCAFWMIRPVGNVLFRWGLKEF